MSPLSVLIACAMFGAQPAEPVSVELRRDADKVVIDNNDDGSVFITVTSASGIGAATLKRSGDTWPKTLLLKTNLRGLEGLTIRQGDVQLRTALKLESYEGFRRDEAGKWQAAILAADLLPKLTKNDGGITIEIPAGWLDSMQDDLLVEWIDFYRN